MQKKNLLKAICVALVAISFGCGEATSEKTETTISAPVPNDSLSSRSGAPMVEDSTKNDSDRNVRPLPPPPPPTNNQ